MFTMSYQFLGLRSSVFFGLIWANLGFETLSLGGRVSLGGHIGRDRPQMPQGYGVGDPQYGFEPVESDFPKTATRWQF